MYTRRAKLVTEFSGAFVVVLVSAGAVCADEFLRSSNRAALGPLGLALAYGVSYAVMVGALGRISGGHFNPAVTIGHWVTHRFSTFDTLSYWTAQLAGAAGAAYLLRSSLPETVWRPAFGALTVAPDLTRAPAMLIEGAMTFFLVLVLFLMTVDKPRVHYWLAGIAAAVVIVVATLSGVAFTGAAINPARAFGPALASSYWNHQGVYWVGPLAGGVAAASLYDLLFRRRRALSSPPEAVPRSY